MKNCIVLLNVIVLLVGVGAGMAQSSNFQVKLIISGSENLRILVGNHMHSIFRCINDIEITDSAPDYVLEVICGDIRTRDGYLVGAAISVLINKPFYYEQVENMISTNYRNIDAIIDMLGGLNKSENHYLHVGSISSLEQMCATVVRDFEQGVLNPIRGYLSKEQ